MTTKILNVPFHIVTRKQALERLLLFLEGDSNNILVTPNPEMVMEAQKNHVFMKTLQEAELSVPDGIGIVLVSRVLSERVAGCDLILSLFEKVKDQNKTVYMLGGKPGVCELAKKRMEKKYPGLHVTGWHHGYFDTPAEKEIIKEIQRLKPDILLVGLGFPKQELWMYRHKHTLPVKISAGIGGSLDIMSGTVQRAPLIFQKLHLEWLYRLIQQPSRARRMLKLPLFLVKVLFSG